MSSEARRAGFTGKTSDLSGYHKFCLKCGVTDRFPSLESLRFFEASARHGNFSRAASELGVTPTAVSLRIRNLEFDLKTRLFTRTGPRIALTEAGADLADRMAEILELTRSAVTACRAATAPLRVTATPTIARRWLAPRLPQYEELPGAAAIRLDVSADLRPADRFDVAIRSGVGPWPGLSSVELLPILRTPMLSPKLTVKRRLTSPFQLLEFTLIRDDHWKLWFEQSGIVEARPKFSPIEYETQDMEALAAIEGAGVALLSPLFFGDLLSDRRLVQPFARISHVGDGYHALRHPQDDRPEVDHFLRWLRAEAKITADSAGI